MSYFISDDLYLAFAARQRMKCNINVAKLTSLISLEYCLLPNDFIYLIHE